MLKLDLGVTAAEQWEGRLERREEGVERTSIVHREHSQQSLLRAGTAQ